MPELPAARRARYLSLGLPLQDVLVLAEEPSIAAFFDAVLVSGHTTFKLWNDVVNTIFRLLSDVVKGFRVLPPK
jgi:Asp-tRNA(Asn)/Glu-tRNA(Gln) amidotransferase B subunit